MLGGVAATAAGGWRCAEAAAEQGVEQFGGWRMEEEQTQGQQQQQQQQREQRQRRKG
jgi:hypothetical protein